MHCCTDLVLVCLFFPAVCPGVAVFIYDEATSKIHFVFLQVTSISPQDPLFWVTTVPFEQRAIIHHYANEFVYFEKSLNKQNINLETAKDKTPLTSTGGLFTSAYLWWTQRWTPVTVLFITVSHPVKTSCHSDCLALKLGLPANSSQGHTETHHRS